MVSFLHECYDCWLGVLSRRSGGVSDFFASSRDLFPPTGLPPAALMLVFVPSVSGSYCSKFS